MTNNPDLFEVLVEAAAKAACGSDSRFPCVCLRYGRNAVSCPASRCKEVVRTTRAALRTGFALFANLGPSFAMDEAARMAYHVVDIEALRIMIDVMLKVPDPS